MKMSGTGGTKGFQGHYLVWLTKKELQQLARLLE